MSLHDALGITQFFIPVCWHFMVEDLLHCVNRSAAPKEPAATAIAAPKILAAAAVPAVGGKIVSAAGRSSNSTEKMSERLRDSDLCHWMLRNNLELTGR